MKKHERERENLIFCKNCGGYYDPNEEQCPHCGEDTKANTETKREGAMSVTQYGGGFGSQNSVLARVAAVILVILLLIVLVVVGVLGVKALKVIGQLNDAQSDASTSQEVDEAETSQGLTPEEEAAQQAAEEAAKQEAADKAREEAEQKANELINSKAKELQLNYTDITLSAGEATQLVVTVEPSTWTGELTWTTSDKYVATVDATGKVTYVSGGECTITVSCKGATQECVVYCKGDAIAQKDGDTTASVTGNYPLTDQEDDSKADQKEQNEQKEDKTDDKEEQDEEKDTKEEKTEPITLDYYDITLVDIGDPHTFQVSGGNGTYEWSSADPSVATVDSNGRVVAVGTGTTVITCTSGDQSKECVVRVK